VEPSVPKVTVIVYEVATGGYGVLLKVYVQELVALLLPQVPELVSVFDVNTVKPVSLFTIVLNLQTLQPGAVPDVQLNEYMTTAPKAYVLLASLFGVAEQVNELITSPVAEQGPSPLFWGRICPKAVVE
jgi:hypothetical protein